MFLPETSPTWSGTSGESGWTVINNRVAHSFPGSGMEPSIGHDSSLSSTIFNHLNNVDLSIPHSNAVETHSAQDVEQTTHFLQQSSIDPDLTRTSTGNICTVSTTENIDVSPRSRVDPTYYDSSPGCRYTCLEPLFPYINDIISPSVTCDLLSVYFIELQRTTFSYPSLYVLVPIIRKKSLLRVLHPRPITRALLCTILWCATKTANIAIFHIPGSRSRISNHSHEVATALIAERDPDCRRRAPGLAPPRCYCTIMSH